MVSAAFPLTAPESTVEPGALSISNGSPVRYASFITPWPSITTPSTGQISCGKTVKVSPIAISSQKRGRDDGDARQDVRAEISPNQPSQNLIKKRHTTKK